MAAKHGLGRGLSSLIPQKKKADVASIDIKEKSQARPALGRSNGDRPPRQRTAPTQKPTQSQVGVQDINLQPTEVAEHESTAKPMQVSDAGKKQLAVVGIAVREITPNTQQPRMYFDDARLAELAASIKEHGIMQPLTVVKRGDGYELIAGERRLRAAKIAGLTKVPAIVRGDMDELKKLELAIIENVQRHDLNVIEEGKSYKKLVDDFSLTQEEIAKKMGKSRSAVANRIRLASLPVEIQRALIDGKITEGHAKVILSLEHAEKQRALFDVIISGKLSVRDTEKALKGAQAGTHVMGHERGTKTPQEKILEDQLGAYFGTKVQVKQKLRGGSITLSYFSQDELKNMLAKLKISD